MFRRIFWSFLFHLIVLTSSWGRQGRWGINSFAGRLVFFCLSLCPNCLSQVGGLSFTYLPFPRPHAKKLGLTTTTKNLELTTINTLLSFKRINTLQIRQRSLISLPHSPFEKKITNMSIQPAPQSPRPGKLPGLWGACPWALRACQAWLMLTITACIWASSSQATVTGFIFVLLVPAMGPGLELGPLNVCSRNE